MYYYLFIFIVVIITADKATRNIKASEAIERARVSV